MKSLTQYISEALVRKHTSKVYNYHPHTKNELKDLINKLIEERGLEADLNDIDTSAIIDISGMFYNSQFDGDISKWDVSNVKDMKFMFEGSIFNGDISNWNVSNVKDMFGMFYKSYFNGDISNWDVSNVTDMSFMFANSPLQSNPPAWYKQ